ncbi:MAG: hypothetical protein ACYDD2_10765 [Candidatus Acidiferrales bacterium]
MLSPCELTLGRGAEPGTILRIRPPPLHVLAPLAQAFWTPLASMFLACHGARISPPIPL